MTCHDAREQLSALLDDALAAAERAAIEAHLATCAECRRELDGLRETVTLLRRVPPVHAPAGFVDRVMTAAHRPPWSRRLLDALFRPLRVKLPLEAAAVLLVAVSALYVYQHTPEVQQLAPRDTRESTAPPEPSSPPAASQPPASEMPGKTARSRDHALGTKGVPVEPGPSREESRPAPPAGTPPVTLTRPGPTSPGGAVQEAPAARSEAGPEATRQAGPPLKSELKKETPAEQRPDAFRAGPPPTGAGARRSAPSPEPPSSRDTAARQVPAPAAPAAPTESVTGGAAAGADAKSRAAGRLMRAVDASGRLTVSSREPAAAALDALLGRLGAKRVARRLEGEQRLVVIDVVVPGPRYRELIEGLGRIGRWVTEYESPTLPPEVRVEVALTVEP
jgi:hypothetical protein